MGKMWPFNLPQSLAEVVAPLPDVLVLLTVLAPLQTVSVPPPPALTSLPLPGAQPPTQKDRPDLISVPQ